MKTKNNKLRINNFFISNTSIFKSTVSLVIYHFPQAFTTADYKISINSCKCRGLWYFQFVANYLRFFQGSSMVIFSVFDSNPQLLFWAILSSKVWFLRIFPQFFIKVFAKVGGKFSVFYVEKRRIWLYCAVCFCNSLISKILHVKQYIKVADLYITENFQRFLFKHTLLRGYVILYWENSIGMSLP